jgi:hypothetical protein
LNVGELAIIKTTGEMVYLMQVDERLQRAEVRRPTLTSEGIVHTSEWFFLGELTTKEGYINQEFQEGVLKFKAQAVVNKEIRKLQKEASIDEVADVLDEPNVLPFRN